MLETLTVTCEGGVVRAAADGAAGACTLDKYAGGGERPTVLGQWPVLRAPSGERFAAARLERVLACVVGRSVSGGGGAGDLTAMVWMDGVHVCSGGDCCVVGDRRAGDVVVQVRRSRSVEGKLHVSVASTARCLLV